jgi:hypothetical protein
MGGLGWIPSLGRVGVVAGSAAAVAVGARARGRGALL